MQSVQHGAPGEFTEEEKAKLGSLMPFKDQLTAFIGNGQWIHDVAAEMDRLGIPAAVPDFRKNGFGPKRVLLLLGFLVNERRWVTPKPRIRATRKMSPAEAAAALAAPRRRISVKSSVA